MKRKMLAMLLAVTVSGALVACSSGEAATGDEENVVETTTIQEEIEETADEEAEENTEADEETSTEETGAASSEETSETAETVNETEEQDVASADNSDTASYDTKWVNFDDMCFYVNGIKYTLGQTTLQEMIDDGVPFDESDLANAGNNLNPNYESSGFSIKLDDKYYSAQVMVLNDTDSGKPMSECVIDEIYLPVNQDIEQDILSFDFPLSITVEELFANSGETDDVYNYEGENYSKFTYTYSQESEKYFSDREYKFEFLNGELQYVTIEWLP